LVGEAHGDAIVVERPDLFDQAVVQLAAPLARQELDDLLATHRKLGSIAPLAIHGVGLRYSNGIAAVPGILGQSNLADCALERERRQWRTFFAHGLLSRNE